MAQTYVKVEYKIARTIHTVECFFPTWYLKDMKYDYENVAIITPDYIKEIANRARFQLKESKLKPKNSIYEVQKHAEALLVHGIITVNPHPIFNMI